MRSLGEKQIKAIVRLFLCVATFFGVLAFFSTFGVSQAYAQTTTISGTLYSDQGSTIISSSPEIVAVVDDVIVGTTTSNGSGVYSISVLIADLAVDAGLILYVDEEVSIKANTISKISSTTATIVDLDLYQDFIIIEHEGATITSLGDFAGYDGTDDVDIQFIASSTLDSFEVLNTNTLFVPGGNTFTLPASTTFNGDIINDGNIQAGTTDDIVTFAGTTILSGAGTTTFPNMTVTDSLTVDTSATSTNALTINSGADFTINSGDTFVLAGNLTNDGTFMNDGELVLQGEAPGELVIDIANASYVQDITVTTQEATPRSVNFNTTGTKMFVNGVAGDDIIEYTLDTAFDIATATFNTATSVASQDILPQGHRFSPDGTKMFLAGNTGDSIYEYSLSSAFDVSTASFNTATSVAAQEATPQGLAFSPDGTKMFVAGPAGDDVNEYTLSTGFDVSTASYIQNYDLENLGTTVRSVDFTADGKIMFIGEDQNNAIDMYALTTGFDVSTATYVDSFGLPYASVQGITYVEVGDTLKLFGVTPTGDGIYEFDVPTVQLSSPALISSLDSLGSLTTTGGTVTFLTPATTTNLTINASSTLGASTTLTITGNYTNNGTFIHNSGEVILAGTAQQTATGTMTGTSTFAKLTITNTSGAGSTSQSVVFGASASSTGTFTALASTSIQFLASTTYSFNDLLISGTSPSPVWLRSSTPGIQWFLTTTAASDVAYSNAQDTNVCGALGEGIAVGIDFTDVSNNSCWFAPSVINISGTVYADFGITALTSSAQIALYNNGSIATTTVTGGGTYSFPSVVIPAEISLSNNSLLLFLDTDGIATTSTLYLPNMPITADITNLDLYQDHVWLNAEAGAEITPEILSTYDSALDSDIGFTATTTGASTLALDGTQTLYLSTTTTLTLPVSATFNGDIINDGMIQSSLYTDTSTFAGTTILSGAGTTTFANMTVADALTLTVSATSSNTLTVNSGADFTINSGNTFTLVGDLTDEGTFVNDGELVLGGGAYGLDVSTASFVDSFSLGGQDTLLLGIAFNPDGTKMFVLGSSNDAVYEYTLSTGFDVSTASYVDNFSVAEQDVSLGGLTFNPDGTKMFVVGVGDQDVNEYTLSTGFDVSTASFVDSFSVSSEDTSPRGLTFNPDGTKMFVVGDFGNDVNEYTLITGFDVSTASFVDSFSVSAQETVPYGLTFNPDGTKMFVVGHVGDDVNEYTLSTGFDVSTASFVVVFSVGAQDTQPTDITFNPGGSKMFVLGATGQDVNEYILNTSQTITSDSNLSNTTIAHSFSGDQTVLTATASNLTINASSTLVASSTLTITGDYENNGTFTHNSSEVIFAGTVQQTATGTMIGASAFSKLTITNTSGAGSSSQSVVFGASASTTNIFTANASTSINFLAGADYSFGALSLLGTPTSPVWLRSSTPGVQWNALLSGGGVIANINLQDANACGSTGGTISVASFTNVSNNTCWSVGDVISISGTVYSDFGSTLLTSNPEVSLHTNGLVLSATADGSGVFTFTDINATSTGRSEYLVYLDTDGGTQATTLLLAPAPYVTDITNLNLYQDYVWLNGEVGTEFVASNFAPYDATDDSDVGFTASTIGGGTFSSAVGQTLYLPATSTFMTPTTATFNGNVRNDGVIQASSTVNTAIFGGTTVLTGSGSTTFANIDVTGDLTIDTTASSTEALTVQSGGTFTINIGEVFNLGGGIENSGTYTNNGILKLTASQVPVLTAAAEFVDSFSVVTEDAIPIDLAFNPDGTKMFVLGAINDAVNEYTLSTGFDVSTASFVDSFSVIAQDSSPTGLAFNPDGTKMFVVGTVNDAVNEYTLSTGFDVSTASFSASTSVVAQESVPAGLAFNPAGTKMFVIGSQGDDVNEYTLSSSFDVTTASFVDSFSVSAQEIIPTGLAFNPDGTKMFVGGTVSDAVHEYNLSTGFDVSTASFVDSFSVSSEDITPRGLAFNPDGTKMFLGGDTGNDVNEYTLRGINQLISPDENFNLGDVQIQQSSTTQFTFFGDATTTDLSIPTGNTLSVISSVAVAGDITNNGTLTFDADAQVNLAGGTQTSTIVWPDEVYVTGAHTVTGGNDFNNITVNSGGELTIDTTASSSKTLTIDAGGAFTINPGDTFDLGGDLVNSGTYTNNGTLVLTAEENTDTDIDITTASFVDSFSVAGQDTVPYGLAFSPDGTKMFAVGNDGDDINEYTLGTAFDVSTASFVDSFSVAGQDTFPFGLTFNPDGTKMFVTGNVGSDINEYTLSTGFDVSTASFVDSFSVGAQDTNPYGLAFNPDGTKMFVVGSAGNDVNEYTLSTGFDVSTASFVDSFSVAAQDTSPVGLTFSSAGTKMFVVGGVGDDVNEYTLGTAFDVSTASFVDSFSVTAQDTFPYGLAFSPDGTKMFVVGNDGDDVNEYTLDIRQTISENLDTNLGNVIIQHATSTAITTLQNATTSDLTISASSTLAANSSLNITGDYLNNGTFTAATSEVIFSGTSQQTATGTMTGASQFNDLTILNTSGDGDATFSTVFFAAVTATGTFTIAPSSSVQFAAGETSTFQSIDWDGTLASPINLRSTVDGEVWYLDVPGTRIAVDFVDVKDSNASTTMTTLGGVNSGNNTNWSFATAPADQWNSDDWTLYDTITIRHENIDEPLRDFPVYVDAADLSAQFWSTVGSDGADIRITTDETNPTELPREVVSASTTLETGELHFKADYLSEVIDTSYRIYYNGVHGAYATDATYGAEEVWSNEYVAVWHLGEGDSTAAGFYKDSTSNNHNQTLTDIDGDTSVVAGALSGGTVDLNGDTDYMTASMPWGSDNSEVTVSYWSEIATADINNAYTFGALEAGGSGVDRFGASAPYSNSDVYWDYGDCCDTDGRISGDYSLFLDKWTYNSFVYQTSPSALRGIYLDGSLEYSNTIAGDPTYAFTDFRIGQAAGGSGSYFNGSFDEFRVASTSRSAAWINAEYINQAASTDFYTLDAVSGFSTSTSTTASYNTATSTAQWVVPAGITELTVKSWGAGGGNFTDLPDFGGVDNAGGGGGFITGSITVVPGETLSVYVGGGGTEGNGGGYINGGAGGGGYSGVFRGSDPLFVAGAGGGASFVGAGAAGGGLLGGDAVGGADGGTQSAGGAGDVGGGADGGYLSGGAGGGGNASTGGLNGGGDSNTCCSTYGGGGGAGYYGGGGGWDNDINAASGAGGSSFATSTAYSTSTASGSGSAAGNIADDDYAGNAGRGGLTDTTYNDGNDGLVVLSWVSFATGSSTIADSDASQVSNAFSFQNKTNEALFAFKITPNSGNATVTRTELVVSGWNQQRLNESDFTNIRLYADDDNDAAYDAGDTLISSTGALSFLSQNTQYGTLVFTEDYEVTAGTNYVVVADWNAPERGARMKLDMIPGGIDMSDATGPVTVSGSVDDVQHARGGGGGGGGSAAVGTDAPEGDGDVGGGTNDGGELIGDDPNYKSPSANSGSWTNPGNAYDDTDGTYATDNSGATNNYSDHGFAIPGSNTINGVAIQLEVSGTTAAGSIGIELSWDGGTSWTSSGNTTPTLTTTDAVTTIGGPSDTWGRTWTDTEFSNANFAVRLTGNPSSNTVQVDAIQVRIYSAAGGGGSGGGGGGAAI